MAVDAAPPRRARLGGVGGVGPEPGASLDPFAVHVIDGGAHRGRDTPGSVTRCAMALTGREVLKVTKVELFPISRRPGEMMHTV